MKNYLFVLCLLAGLNTLAQEKQPGGKDPSPPVPDQAGITVTDLPVRPLLKPGYVQQQIQELNPAFDVYLLSHEKDLSLQLAIVDNISGDVTIRSAASNRISVSPVAAIIAMATNRDHPGYLNPDGHTNYAGIEVMDATGKPLYRTEETGLIYQFFPDHAGNLLLSSERGLRMLNVNGKVRWDKPAVNATVEWISGNEYFSIDRFDHSIVRRTIEVADAVDGRTVYSYTCGDMEVVKPLGASRSKQELILGRLDETRNPATWTMEAISLRTGTVQSFIRNVDGKPCFMRYNTGRNVYEMILWLAQPGSEPFSYQVHFATWMRGTVALNERPLGSYPINLLTSGLYGSAVQETYAVKLGKQIITIQP